MHPIIKLQKTIFLYYYWSYFSSNWDKWHCYVIKPLLDEIFVNKNEAMLSVIPFLVIGLYAAKGFGR